MVERGGIPAHGGMALGAVRGGESRAGAGVHWVIGLLPGCEVAARIATIGGLDLQTVIAIDMALRALHGGVLVL